MNILKLKGKMVETEHSIETLAAKLGVDRSTLYRKMNDGSKFTIEEAQKIKNALELSDEETWAIFFG